MNYFESSQYASQVDDFLHWFYDIKIQLPQVSIPLDSIEVSKEEILDAKVNSNQYSNYLYNENTDEQISITSLSDEELKQLIQF
ncbi:sensor histidine kinase, partial [Turicibacter sanguinis]|nr:sensor histidine kinase [Turicibacter sanguinis]